MLLCWKEPHSRLQMHLRGIYSQCQNKPLFLHACKLKRVLQCMRRECMNCTMHVAYIHTWDNGFCSFHAQNVCSCGKCGDEELKCKGKPYESKNIVTCPLHALAYEIDCETRARNAAQVIHSELGKGHSHLCESAFSVLPKFRAKNLALHRIASPTCP